MTRDEAIATLRGFGHDASARDWSMGETIVIPVGAPEESRGIRCHPGGAVYLCPRETGRWALFDLYHQDSRSRVAGFAAGEEFPDLETAVSAAHAYVVEVEAARGGRDWDDVPSAQHARARRECAWLAALVLRGDVDLVDGCFELKAALHAAGLDDDPDARRIVGFCSDADRFPSRDARSRWDADGLVGNDVERDSYVREWRDRVISACEGLLKTLTPL